ncbi:MAG TPA: GDSL-type esterase/lipase family protein [Planctomycetota bacterium]|nr:GDSL-type esterase/lipase family protein [Planctomycetota bacterium]
MRISLPILLMVLATHALGEDWVKHYADRVAAFEAENRKLEAGTKHVVLVGDSLTEGWNAGRIKKFLPTVAERVLNRGISADGVGLNERGVLNRLGPSVFDCKASHVFLLIGVNDIGHDGHAIDGTARALEKVVKTIHEKGKGVELVLITQPPTTKRYADMNPAIVRYNAKVLEIAAATSTAVIDLHARVKDDKGALPEKWTTDGLHWTDGVYEVLGKEIEVVLARPVRRK